MKGLFWLDALCGLAVLYILFHMTPLIQFLDRAIAP